LSDRVEAGRYLLPGAPTSERETLVTSPLNAEPQYLLRIPRPSGWHLWGAVFTAGFFLILTIQAYAAAVVSGVLAIYCILRWCWFLDRPNPRAQADVGAGVLVPTYVAGPASHGWWAMVITLIVGGMVCLLAGFSYVFLWSRRPDLWSAPAEGLAPVLALIAAGALSAVAAPRILRLDRPRSGWVAAAALFLSAAALAGAALLDGHAWMVTGLRPEATSHGAAVFALLGWQAVFAAVGAIMGLYAVMRWLFGLLSADRPSTYDLIALFLTFTAAQGAFVALLPRVFPGG
jgi:cytochrome c oxidase subunit I+III